ncbi:MAG: DMT family transporter [Rhodospirillaceae bacterium]|nr:DMT family transporter [Rhodospirillaceae bacterium]
MSEPTIAGTVSPQRPDNPALGIGATLAGALVRTVNDAAGKFAVADFPIPQYNAVRSVFTLGIMLPGLAREGGWRALRTQRPWAHALRGAIQVFDVFLWFVVLRNMALADAAAIGLSTPVMTTLMSALVLKEKVGPRRWAAVLIGFVGMLLIVRPGTGLFNPYALLAIVIAASFSVFVITNRFLRHTETVTALAFWPQAAVGVVAIVWAPFVWQPLTASGLTAMVVGGLAAGATHLLIAVSFRSASPALLAPFDYTVLIWAVGIGYVMFGDLPTASTVAGMVLIAGAGVFIAYREARVAAS